VAGETTTPQEGEQLSSFNVPGVRIGSEAEAADGSRVEPGVFGDRASLVEVPEAAYVSNKLSNEPRRMGPDRAGRRRPADESSAEDRRPPRPAAERAAALLAADGSPPSPAPQGLVDELSSRELDVLRLLRRDLSGPEIAAELVVSINTVRTHTKNIFMKLGVNSRRAALRRADELGL
jgi:DNA-binding CsgD family transcriptional regulator